MTAVETAVRIPVGSKNLDGDLAVPPGAIGVVLFAHGSGSGRHSPRNRSVAAALNHSGLATLLLDLLTADEEAVDVQTRHHRFDIPMLADRLGAASDWLARHPETADLSLGLFGASTGAAAALITAARRPEQVRAVVSRGGRPDLAEEHLADVRAAVLLIVGGNDDVVLGLNRGAYDLLAVRHKRLEIIPGATHLFEEPGALDRVAGLAVDWFVKHLPRTPEG